MIKYINFAYYSIFSPSNDRILKSKSLIQRKSLSKRYGIGNLVPAQVCLSMYDFLLDIRY